LNKLEDIISVYEIEQLEVFRAKLESNADFGKEMLSTIFDEEHLNISEQKNAGTKTSSADSKSAKDESVDDKEHPWTPKETATLIKAVKLFPGGSLDRWSRIADYVNEHGQEGSTPSPRTVKQIISYSKQVQQGKYKK
jgi:DnaJ family protein C protein 2